MSLDAFAAWAGIFLCLSQSAMLSGLNLACFSVSRLQLEILVSGGDRRAARVLALRQGDDLVSSFDGPLIAERTQAGLLLNDPPRTT